MENYRYQFTEIGPCYYTTHESTSIVYDYPIDPKFKLKFEVSGRVYRKESYIDSFHVVYDPELHQVIGQSTTFPYVEVNMDYLEKCIAREVADYIEKL